MLRLVREPFSSLPMSFCITVFLRAFLREERASKDAKDPRGCHGLHPIQFMFLVGQTHMPANARNACKKILNDATSIPRFGKVVRRRASANKDNSTARPLAPGWWMNRLSTITSSPRRRGPTSHRRAGQRHSHFVNCHSSGPRRIEQTCAPHRSQQPR